MERVYRMSWLVFFQDYLEFSESQDSGRPLADVAALLNGDYRNSDAVMKYLALGEAESVEAEAPLGPHEHTASARSYDKRGSLSNLRRWA